MIDALITPGDMIGEAIDCNMRLIELDDSQVEAIERINRLIERVSELESWKN